VAQLAMLPPQFTPSSQRMMMASMPMSHKVAWSARQTNQMHQQPLGNGHSTPRNSLVVPYGTLPSQRGPHAPSKIQRKGCNGPRLTIVYWEPLLLGTSAPSRCHHCGGVAQSFRQRWDNLHATLRSCGKEGRTFREDVDSFVALSSFGVLEYNFDALHHYMQAENKKALTEEVVLGCAAASDPSGQAGGSALECSVVGRRLFGPAASWDWWLCRLVSHLCSRASDAGGSCVGLLLDTEGQLPEALGEPTGGKGGSEAWMSSRSHSRSRGGPQRREIAEVLLILGGPKGIDVATSEIMHSVLQRGCSQVRCLQLPGGALHSNVALAGFFLLVDWDRRFWRRLYRVRRQLKTKSGSQKKKSGSRKKKSGSRRCRRKSRSTSESSKSSSSS